MRKKQLLLSMLTMATLLLTPNVSAQMTVGGNAAPQGYSVLELESQYKSGIYGGLRLPQMTTAQRNALAVSGQTKAEGLVIYNTTTKCVEYWNSKTWISLCSGVANIDLSPSDPSTTPFPPAGDTKGPITPSETPACTGTTPPYTCTIMSGSDYTRVNITNTTTGAFTVTMDPNTTAMSRTAVLRITNNCTKEYKEYLYTQNGDASLCTPTASTKPLIAAGNGTTLCAGGAVYLSISNVNSSYDYVWALNDVQVGTGTSYTATQAGNYKVYVGAIGCTGNNESAATAVTGSATTAPATPAQITANNGGVLCGGNSVTVTYNGTVGANTLTWYKDGVKTAKTGTSITVATAEAGIWTAVLTSGSCSSVASNELNITTATGTALTLAAADVLINGVAINSASLKLCPGSPITMQINNPVTGVEYEWKINGTSYGRATNKTYTIPSDLTSIIIECVATKAGSCVASVNVNNTFTVTQPAKPSITGANIVCSGASITLTATGSTGTFQWYKDGSAISGATSSTYAANTGGIYTVQTATSGSATCLSPMSNDWTLTLASQPTNVQMTVAPATGNVSTAIQFQASATNATSWGWSATGGATSSSTTNQASFTWGTDGAYTVTATAQNACGTAQTQANITIGTLKMATPAPVVVSGGSNSCGTAIVFEVPSGYADMANATSFTWTVTAPGSYDMSKVTYIGNKNERIVVPYINSTPNTTYSVTVKADGNKPTSAVSSTVSGTGYLDATNVFLMGGNDCYDIAKTQYDPAVIKYGYMSSRQNNRINPSNQYAYTVTRPTGSGGTVGYAWTVSDPSNLLVSNPSGATTSSINLQFVSSVLNDVRIVNKPDVNLVITVSCVVTVSGSGCNPAYTLTKTIKVGDRDCCSGVTDMEGNTYTATMFGTAGCWMTQNLRSKKSPANTVITQGNNSANSYTANNYYYPNNNTSILNTNPEYGLLYTWVGASNGASTDDFSSGAGSKASTVQGICPDGWVLPSDYDFNLLEQEIANNAAKYNTTSAAATAWSTSWASTSGSYRGTHGKTMKSPTAVNGTATSGISKTDGTGWNGLLVGYLVSGSAYNYGSISYYWSSSVNSSSFAWYRFLYSSTDGVSRNNTVRYVLFSVRCKKKDN